MTEFRRRGSKRERERLIAEFRIRKNFRERGREYIRMRKNFRERERERERESEMIQRHTGIIPANLEVVNATSL